MELWNSQGDTFVFYLLQPGLVFWPGGGDLFLYQSSKEFIFLDIFCFVHVPFVCWVKF